MQISEGCCEEEASIFEFTEEIFQCFKSICHILEEEEYLYFPIYFTWRSIQKCFCEKWIQGLWKYSQIPLLYDFLLRNYSSLNILSFETLAIGNSTYVTIIVYI